jgi:DNA-binding PadR family transcriptional regulator
MEKTANERVEIDFLKRIAQTKDSRLAAKSVKEWFDRKAKASERAASDPIDAEKIIAGLIENGFVDTSGGPKEGPHPRAKASYRITDKGKHHIAPTRPEIPDTQLKAQEAFILLQLFQLTPSKGPRVKRSDLNDKLKTTAAKAQLEFDTKNDPNTVDYHLASLAARGCLTEFRKGSAFSYQLVPERGIAALVQAKQHDAVKFQLTGELLNALIDAARGSAPAAHPKEAPPTAKRELAARDIEKLITDLRANEYAGKNLIPIHAVRRVVREQFDAEAASHPVFDALVKQMRSDGQIRLIAITDIRDASPEEMADSIPGVNEALFYIGAK